MDMKTHEFAAIAIVLLLVVWVGFAALSPAYAARNGLLPSVLGGLGANLAGNNGAAAGSGAGAGNTGGSPSGSSALGGPGQTVTIPIKVVSGIYDPRQITVKQGTKVRLDLDPATFRGCMSVFNIWGLNQKMQVSAQNRILEFTADTPGVYKTSCGMGMGDGRFIVEAAGANPAAAAAATGGSGLAAPTNAAAAPAGGSCGASGGGCGCGG